MKFLMNHLCFANLPYEKQAATLKDIITSNSEMMDLLYRLRQMELPDDWIVSGAIYNNLWNYLTGRPWMHGVKDVDVFYFDQTDLSYEAEDKKIKQSQKVFAQCPVPVELRNQARVHLWYKDHFGHAYPALSSYCEAIDRFASITHSVGVRLNAKDQLELYAPYGLNEVFSFRIAPNYLLNNAATHAQKALRAKKHWPELTIIPWEPDPAARPAG